MDIEGGMEGQVAIQVHQLEPIEVEKPAKERATGQIESPKEERTDLLTFIKSPRDVVRFRSGPLDH